MRISPNQQRHLSVLFILTVCAVSAAWAGLHNSQPVASASTSRETTAAPRALRTNALTPASTIVVNSTADTTNSSDGFCTLREAIAAANTDTASGVALGECAAGSGDDTIDLTGVTGTINLTAVLPAIATNISLNGPGSSLLTIRRNTGGEYRVLLVNGLTVVSISGVTITNGKLATGNGDGGGINNAGQLTLIDVVVSGNQTSDGTVGIPDGGHGGGISNQNGSLTMINCVVSGNRTGNGAVGGQGGRGGGIFSSAVLTVVNSVVSGNITGNGPVAGAGGGIYTSAGFTMTNSTVTNNTSSTGAGHGVSNFAPSANIGNTIVAQNGTGGTGPDMAGAYSSRGHNLVGNATGSSGFTNGSNGDQVGTGAAPLNPLLGPLGNNGGQGQSHALLPGSPAIDAGNNCVLTNSCVPALPSAITNDQRGTGFSRSADGNGDGTAIVDIGAFEVQSILVTNTNDSGPGSLRQAIIDANANSDSNAINFQPGLTGTISLSTALPDLSTSLAINGPGVGVLTVQRAISTFGIFQVSSNPTVSISGLNIQGDGPPGGALGFFDFGINNSGTTNVTNCTVSGFGRGVQNLSTLTISNCVVSGNTNGGGISNPQGTLYLIDSVVSGNNSNGAFGPGINNSATLIVTNSTVTGNQGHIAVMNGAGATATFINTTISNNSNGGLINNGTFSMFGGSVTGNQNGGIVLGGNSVLNGVSVSNNSNNGGAFPGGGGIFVTGSSASHSSLIINCLVTNNSTNGDGGGIRNGGSKATIINTTVSGNNAVGRGGGINTVDGGLAAFVAVNLTITGNRAGFGGGVFRESGPMQLRNSIIAANHFQNGTSPSDIGGTIDASSSFNLIGVGGSGGLSNGVNNNQVGVADPRLGPLANNGGPTLTHALLPGSPAINAGSNANLPLDTHDLDGDSNTSEPLPFDQRGFARVSNTTVDIGAFESRGFTISATSGTPQSTPIGTTFAQPLVATVNSAFGEPVSGGVITFTAPASGARGTFPGGVTTATANTNGSGVATSPALTANMITGVYNVTAGGAGIASPASFSLTNAKGTPSIIVISQLNPSKFGESVTFIASVNHSAVQPTGTVQFKDGVTDLGLPASCDAGPGPFCTARISISTLSIGTHNISATYSGDANLESNSESLSGGQVVNQATSTTTLSSSVTPSEFGQTVTFTAIVSSSAGVPTGTVQFQDDLNNLGPAVSCVAANAHACTAQFSISTLSVGNHSISATYSGDANILGSSGTLAGGQVVKAQPTLSINDVSITEGNSGTTNLTFTVTLSAASNLTVTAGYSATNGTATTADNDYQSTPGTVTFTPGDLTETVTIVVNGDQKTEPDETFFVSLSNPVNAAFSDSQGTGTILNDDNLLLLLDTSGPAADQLAALDSLLLARDPFRVLNQAPWLSSEQNTRVILFAANLNSGESPSDVKIMLLDGSGTHEVTADDIRAMEGTTFTQVTFRLPNALAPGTCLVSIKAHGRISNTGTFRVIP